MDIGNFLQKHQLEIILAFIFAIIAAILIPIFWDPIKKFFVSISVGMRKSKATKKFEQKYRDWLIEKYKFLNVRGIKTNAPVTIELERVFVSLKAKRPKPIDRILSTPLNINIAPGIKSESSYSSAPILDEIEFEIEEGIDKMPLSKKFWREHFLISKEEYETEKTYELKDLFNLPNKRFIIIGAPGSGKTTLLNYLALKFARKSEKELFGIENEFLPIFINLRDTIKEGFLDVRKFVENYNNYIECPHSRPQGFFEKRLEDGKCIFLLDGLDEVAKDEERIRVAKWVDELATIYSRNMFIATSRPYGYESARLYNDFLELHVLDFTQEQVEEFVRYWTKAVEIKAREDESEYTLKEAEKKANDLLKAIKKNPKIKVLTVNPLLLTIVSLVHRYRAILPKRRVELYEECCDVLLGYWDTSKGLAGELEPRKKRTILQPLAYHLHLNGLREEKREKFVELLENELPKIGVAKDRADDFLEDIRDRCGILVETKLGFFGFTHLTFQEFLTARYILDNDLENFLVAKKRDRYWLEVTLLYCGMKDTTKLLQKILKEKEDMFYTNLFIAGRCLAESLSVDPELRSQITQKLFDIYWDPKEFRASGEISLAVLREVKEERMIQKFIAKTEDEDNKIRERGAYALGQIKAKEAVAPLIKLLKEKEGMIGLTAALALAHMQAQEAVSSLLELLKDKDSDHRWWAALALGDIQAKEAVLPLINLLKDKDSNPRNAAAIALGRIRASQAVLPLIGLLNDREEHIRGNAAAALGEIQAREAVYPLLELLRQKSSYVTWRAGIALGQIQAKEAILPLIELLKDRESDVRASAAEALGQMEARKAVLPLIELLKDRESDVRASAAEALGQMQVSEAISPLIELLKDTGSDVRASAAEALGHMQAREAVLPLIELLKDKEGDVRARAAEALEHMQAGEAVLSLTELLKDKEGDVRACAAEALGQMQVEEAALPSIELLNDEESEVRQSAAFLLAKVGDKNAVAHLKLLLNDPESEVRETAFKALKEISEKTGTPIYGD